jgi:two-component system, OmpR family, response regulator
MRILVIEDDARTRQLLLRGLTESGHIVDAVGDGATGLAHAREPIYDVVVSDRTLPLLDGIALVRQLRTEGIDTPLLMISAAGGLHERVDGIRAGCDDYLAKPYAFAELLARVEGLARRTNRSRMNSSLACFDLVLDIPSRSATRAGRALRLQHREFLLLECLLRHEGHVVTRAMLLEAAWNYDFEPRGNIVDMHMHRLRGKVDRNFDRPLIHTVVGAGYMVSANAPTGALRYAVPHYRCERACHGSSDCRLRHSRLAGWLLDDAGLSSPLDANAWRFRRREQYRVARCHRCGAKRLVAGISRSCARCACRQEPCA